MAVTKAAEGWKAKQWYNLVAPDMFGKTNIGETVAEVPEKLIGRVVEVTLGELTNDLSKQNTKLLLKIDRVGGDSAYTKFIGHQDNSEKPRAGVTKRPKVIDSRSILAGVRGFKSLPPHLEF